MTACHPATMAVQHRQPSLLTRAKAEARAVWAGLRQAVRSEDDMKYVLKILSWITALSWTFGLPACALIRWMFL